MMTTDLYQVGCYKIPEEKVWAENCIDLSAQVWPEASSETSVPTEEEEQENVWEPYPQEQAGSICHLSHRLRCR